MLFVFLRIPSLTNTASHSQPTAPRVMPLTTAPAGQSLNVRGKTRKINQAGDERIALTGLKLSRYYWMKSEHSIISPFFLLSPSLSFAAWRPGDDKRERDAKLTAGMMDEWLIEWVGGCVKGRGGWVSLQVLHKCSGFVSFLLSGLVKICGLVCGWIRELAVKVLACRWIVM